MKATGNIKKKRAESENREGGREGGGRLKKED